MTNLEQQIEAIMLRLDKVEAGLFGEAGKAKPQVHGIVNTLDAPATGNSEKPNTHEPPTQPVYEAGFVFYGNDSELMLPDGTDLYLRIGRNHWVKETEDDAKPQPHTLTPVSQHTVGKFYALAGVEPNHLNDWRSYALCVKNEDVPYFVRPTSEYGIVSIDRTRPSHVSLNEVTPV